MPRLFNPATDCFQPAAPVCAHAWRWYWSST